MRGNSRTRRPIILARRSAAGSGDERGRRQDLCAECGPRGWHRGVPGHLRDRAARGHEPRRLDRRGNDDPDGLLVGYRGTAVRGYRPRAARRAAAARRHAGRRPRQGLRQHDAVPDPRRVPARARDGALQPAPAHRLRDRHARGRPPAGTRARHDVRDRLREPVDAEHGDHAHDAAGRALGRGHRRPGCRHRGPQRRELRQGDRALRRLRGDHRRARHGRRHCDQRARRRLHGAELRRDDQLRGVAGVRHPDRAAPDAGRLAGPGARLVPVPARRAGNGTGSPGRRAPRARADVGRGTARHGRIRRDGGGLDPRDR